MSLRVALASAIPNLFPILGTEAWLWLTGSGLQLTTVIALTIAFGIAVDDTVHFLSHYLQARREEGRDHLDAVKHTMERIGGAIVATTIILCSGTVIVAFSELPQVALFGQLFVSTLAFALLGDLFILPALLAAGDKFFQPLGGIRMADAERPSRSAERGRSSRRRRDAGEGQARADERTCRVGDVPIGGLRCSPPCARRAVVPRR